MFYILALIIILYTSSYLIFKKNPTFLKVRKWVDLATIVVTSILVVVWVEVFDYSFLFLVYFFVSLGLIVSLIYRLRILEAKKQKAQETIKILKDEEKVLENEINDLKVEDVQK